VIEGYVPRFHVFRATHASLILGTAVF
jgi:hypothetical protein